jgi:hypothetical protein
MFVDFWLGVKAGFTAGAEQVDRLRLHCQQRRRTVEEGSRPFSHVS